MPGEKEQKDREQTLDISDPDTYQLDHLAEPLTIEGVPSSFSAEDWPARDMGRYELISLLGHGGMGRVFKAYDPNLNRHVALKFILGESQNLTRRFVREAQAQARVEHENVCKIYEVSQVQDKPYIAMQYIDGRTLNRLYKEMTLKEKIAVMRDVCEGIHAAHRLGLIHRDIKPGNIMVEKRDNGWHPYIMDFGLARPMHSAELTQAGLVVGTPAYMSPEQASGDRNLDRRSEVYSLGATLYAIVSGRPPFEGSSPIEVLSNIASTEPAAIRHHDENVPRELETIILKCLEKNPAHRYETARALADDLQRFLDGEPIQARPHSIAYRMIKKIRKNRIASAITAAALVLSLALGGVAVHSYMTSQTRAAAAQQFGQDVERIDSIMRFACMLPLHDITREKNLVRLRMKDIVSTMHAMGSAASGPGEYAIGRGHLALHEYEPARQHLETAWQQGYRSPEVSYGRGLALSGLYLQEMERAEKILDKQQRAQRIQTIEHDLRDPALLFLQEARSVRTDAPEYVSALIAYQEKKYPQALQLAQRAFDRVPWLYEAIGLQGDVYLRLAREERDRSNYDKARENFGKANAAYRRSIEMAQSDPATYDRVSASSLTAMAMELYYAGGDAEEGYHQIMEAVERSLKADPHHPDPLVRKSQASSAFAEYKAGQGQDTSELERQAIDAANAAITMEPSSGDGYTARASAYQQQAATQTTQGKDPRAALQLAEADFLKSLSIKPDDAVYNDLGYTYLTAGEYESDHGINPATNLRASIEAYQNALKIQPGNFICYNNLGITYDTMGLYELQQGKDPSAPLRLALKNYQKAAEMSPGWSFPLSNQGNSYLYLADYQQRKGEDPMPNIRKAIECFQKAVVINPKRANFHSNVAGAATAAAGYFVRIGKDPESWLKQAEESARKAQQIKESDYYFPLQLGMVDLIRARWALKQNNDPTPLLTRSASLIAKSMQLNTDDPDVFVASAENCWLLATWQHRQGKSSQFENGIRDARRALELRPDHSRAMAVQAALMLLQSNGKIGADLLSRALQLDPSLRFDFP